MLLNKRYTIRMSEEEFASITSCAKTCGLTVSEWCRIALAVARAQGIDTSRDAYVIDVTTWVRLQRELYYQGVNFNQAVRGINRVARTLKSKTYLRNLDVETFKYMDATLDASFRELTKVKDNLEKLVAELQEIKSTYHIQIDKVVPGAPRKKKKETNNAAHENN